MDNKILHTKDIIEVLGFGKEKTYHMLRNNIIPSTKIGKQYIILESDLFQWIRKNMGKEINLK